MHAPRLSPSAHACALPLRNQIVVPIDGGVRHAITSHRANLSALALHPTLPRLASGSRNQFIKLFDVQPLRDGAPAKEVHNIRYFDGFLGARIGPVTTLAFHPSRLLLAVGATDSTISVYSDSKA